MSYISRAYRRVPLGSHLLLYNESEALEAGFPRWKDAAGCDKCGGKPAERYVGHPGSCVDCLAREAMAGAVPPNGYNWMFVLNQAGQRTVCPRGPHFIRRDMLSGRCVGCMDANPRIAARRAGLKTYLDDCVTCGPGRPHKVSTGRCLACHNVLGELRAPSPPRGPRAVARRAGLKTYLDDCATCGPGQPHTVTVGKCLTCHTTAGFKRATPGKVRPGRPGSPRNAIKDLCPDLVLPRRQAIEQGWNVYRTGTPCSAGHTGWRYVKTYQCIECLRIAQRGG